ncbi:dUTP diphosphatase [Paraherbaspirillum soli]|uniref:dUTP diphosphatase n=1 Tax=Paraherbaspirillum soli TaxID=631222 RepID=A0ABW0M830_9BURK
MRASVVEGAEAMEHHGWKWWKKQEMDKAQFAMELVDIWHFTLSHAIVVAKGDMDAAASLVLNGLESTYGREGLMFDGRYYKFAKLDTIDRVELLIGISVSRRSSIPLFETLLTDVGVSWDELYCQYVGKNVLNLFRQDNGYKEGTYLKIWPQTGADSLEDNQVLVKITDKFPNLQPEELYSALQTEYQAAVTLQAA